MSRRYLVFRKQLWMRFKNNIYDLTILLFQCLEIVASGYHILKRRLGLRGQEGEEGAEEDNKKPAKLAKK